MYSGQIFIESGSYFSYGVFNSLFSKKLFKIYENNEIFIAVKK
jgi:hypothetical protein